MSLPAGMLDGYTVLDFTQVLAGPTTTRLMAELGAEIIKIELAPTGDASRALPYLRDGRSAYYIQQNRGKKSVCLDLRSEKAKEIVRGLVRSSDVVVENFSPGAIGRLGFSWEVVRELNPRAVMCSISALGQSGPLSNLPGYDYIAQAYAGVTHMIGDPDGPPSFPMLGLGDVSAGVHAAAAIGFALLHRERSGRGQYIDISLLNAYFHAHELNVQIYSASGGATEPKRGGSHHYAVCPLGLFKGRERYMFIIALPRQWERLCEVIGRPELAEDPELDTNEKRLANQERVIRMIEDWIATQPSDDDAIAALEKARVAVAPVLSIAEAVNHEHHRFQRTVRTIQDPVFGSLDVPGMPLRFSDFPDELPLEADHLGQHNEAVLTGKLGMSAAEVAALEREGVLVQDANT